VTERAHDGKENILTRSLPVIDVVNLDSNEHIDGRFSDVGIFRAPVDSDARLQRNFQGC